MQPKLMKSAGVCSLPLEPDSLHDLISPVNQVCTMTGLILKRYRGTLDNEADTLFGFLESSTNRLQQLVTGLRVYTRIIGAPAPCQRCSGNDLLAAAISLVRSAIDESEAVLTHESVPELYCDSNQITYALACLIDNAVKFRRDIRPEIHIGAAPERECCRLFVRDNGIGIDPSRQGRIFGVFQRLPDHDRPGAGMGLAIARQVVERHGGRIWVESQPGQGSTFFIELPDPGGAVS